jgi:hypothetical protein
MDGVGLFVFFETFTSFDFPVYFRFAAFGTYFSMYFNLSESRERGSFFSFPENGLSETAEEPLKRKFLVES